MRVSTGAVLAAVSATAYGSLAVFGKIAYQEGWNTPSVLVARFSLAALFILGPAWRVGTSWRSFPAAMALGAFGYASASAFFFPSLQYVPAAVSSFLLYLAPVFVAIILRAMGERISRRGFVGLALSVVGLAAMTSGAFTGALSSKGVMLGVGAAVAFAVTLVVSRRVLVDLSWPRVSLGVALGAFLTYTAFGLATDQLVAPPSLRAGVSALGMGIIATGLSLSLLFAAIARIGPSRAATISTLEPVSTLFLAAFFLNEIPDWTGIVGGLFIMGGAAIVAGEEEIAVTE